MVGRQTMSKAERREWVRQRRMFWDDVDALAITARDSGVYGRFSNLRDIRQGIQTHITRIEEEESNEGLS